MEDRAEKKRKLEFLKLEVHNINGIKKNSQRLQELIDFSKEQNLNIVGITETNIKKKEAKFIDIHRKGYRDYWLNSDQDKHKGSGVGLLVDGPW
ncbi:12417_t:CDS:1, partial [Gigaspora margarita]